jgi:hypothetical protein
MSKANIVLDASKYDTFELCPQRYHNRYNLNLTAPVKAKQLDRGTVAHVAAEVYYEGLQKGIPYQDCVVAALSSIRAAGVISSDLEPEEIERIIDVMEEYFDYWRVADQNFQIVEVEKPFLYILHEDDEVRIAMAGKIDLVTSDNQYENCPMDHKTQDRSREPQRMSNQFKNYCYALKSNYIVVNQIGFQKTLKPHEKFKRPRLSYDPLIFKQWKDNVVRNLMWYLQCVADNIWPMNETSCDKYNRQCEYYEVCDSSGQQAKEYKLATSFARTDPWDVTKILRKSTEVMADAKKATLEVGND